MKYFHYYCYDLHQHLFSFEKIIADEDDDNENISYVFFIFTIFLADIFFSLQILRLQNKQLTLDLIEIQALQNSMECKRSFWFWIPFNLKVKCLLAFDKRLLDKDRKKQNFKKKKMCRSCCVQDIFCPFILMSFC